MNEFDRLLEVMARLRAPDGCPWDREQSHTSILPDLLEEAYEFMEAAESGDAHHMKEELGDLLLQVVFHAQIASEEEKFSAYDVCKEITDKLIRRHPHVFGDVQVSGTDEVWANWDAIKRAEQGKENRVSALDGVPAHFPALLKAQKIQKKAARVGFDWPEKGPVLDKVEEEFAEFREALESGNLDHAEDELGDILFSMVNVARHHGISAEDALRRTITKFTTRFNAIEEMYQWDLDRMKAATLEELDAAWEKSKGVSKI